MTDYKDNLHEMFIPGKEVVAYRDADEAVEQISYYLTHEEERKQIVGAGRRRTLRNIYLTTLAIIENYETRETYEKEGN